MLEGEADGPFDALGGVVEVTADVRARRPDPAHIACISVVDGDLPHLAVLPEMSVGLRREVEQWAADRLERLRARGPGPDGWGVWILADGRMAAQLWVRSVRVRVSPGNDPYRAGPRASTTEPGDGRRKVRANQRRSR
jgi:hypothetical protein